MNGARVSIQEVVDTLRSEDLLPEGMADRADDAVKNMNAVQPWYIRTLVGFGAWLASILLIGFVAGIGVSTGGGYVVIGLGLIVAAVFARRGSGNDFVVQSSLACSLAGQALLAYGVVDMSGGDEFEGVLSIAMVISAILFFIFPDRIHRVLSVLIATTSLSILLYVWELNVIVPVLGPAYAAVLIFLHKRQGQFLAQGKGHLVRPLLTGMMLSAFGFLLLSTAYVLPELELNFSFYPRPWISTILLGALFLYLGTQMWPQLTAGKNSVATPVLYGLMLVVIATAWAAPGLLLALVVVLLGASSGNRMFIGAGITFLTVFIATYFYGIEITMLTKSVTLVSSGIAVLLARWLILKALADSTEGEASHV
jgi:hypothetical protein